jgi:hypothetical protein
MKSFSILFVVLIGYWAIHWNSVQANDDDASFEEGKLLFLRFAFFFFIE